MPGRLDAAYLRNLKVQRGSITYRGAMLNIHRYRLKASSCPDIFRNSMVTITEEKVSALSLSSNYGCKVGFQENATKLDFFKWNLSFKIVNIWEAVEQNRIHTWPKLAPCNCRQLFLLVTLKKYKPNTKYLFSFWSQVYVKLQISYAFYVWLLCSKFCLI